MRKSIVLLCGVSLVAGCNPSEAPDANAAANATNAAAARKPKHYCFFRKEDSKGWAASRDADGNVTVTGKVHTRDPRYKGELGQPEVTGTSAKVWVSYLQNNDQYRSADDWFDLSFTIPGSKAVQNVAVGCDAQRTLAELTVKG